MLFNRIADLATLRTFLKDRIESAASLSEKFTDQPTPQDAAYFMAWHGVDLIVKTTHAGIAFSLLSYIEEGDFPPR